MRRWGLALVLLLGCGPPDYPPTPEGLYLRHCSRCHEEDGSSATASKLADFTVDLRGSLFQSTITDAELRQIIRFGKGRMEGIDGITVAEADSVVLHVRRLAR